MKLLIFFYLFVVGLHAFFIGVSAYAVFGNRLTSISPWITMSIFSLLIAFFEFYWIPVFQSLGISVYFDHPTVLSNFGISKEDNIVGVFKLSWFHPILFLLGGFVAQRIGLFFYKKK